jgi:hypothetical protein
VKLRLFIELQERYFILEQKEAHFRRFCPLPNAIFHSPGWKSVQVSSVRPILDFILSNNEFYYSQVRSNLASVIENLPQILTQAS